MKLTDELFLKIMRGRGRDGINPGLDLDLSNEIRSMASETTDMQDNLWFMYAISVGMKAKRVLEIGCNDGTSTLPFLKAAFEIDGHVDSIDISEVPVAKAIINKLELQSRWTFTKGNSHDVLKKFIAEKKQFDLILIDGDHSYAGAKEDLIDCEKMLAAGGFIFTHDNWMAAIDVDWNKPMGERGVAGDALLARDMLMGNEWVGLVFPFNCNLGIFRRRADCIGEVNHSINEAVKQGFIKRE